MNCKVSGRKRFWVYSYYLCSPYTRGEKNHACAVFDVAAVVLMVKIFRNVKPCRLVEQFKPLPSHASLSLQG